MSYMSAIGALLGLVLAIVLIIKKVSPVYSMIAGALLGGLLSGFGLVGTVNSMISGVKDITPAVLRILSAGILSGMLVKTGAAASISRSIVRTFGTKYAYVALALSTLLLTAVGVFVDVAVITVAPIAIELGRKFKLSPYTVLLAMIAGGKCGNVISPNPNTIIASENFGAPLISVMGANVVPALVGFVVTIFLILPLADKCLRRYIHSSSLSGESLATNEESISATAAEEEKLPSFWASVAGPLTAVILLALRPIANVVIDPLIALPIGGLVGILTTKCWSDAGTCVAYGLEKMSGVAILLIGTGTIAGIIKDSAITAYVVDLISKGSISGTVMAPVSSALMSAATASTTAGATLASSSFAQSILGSGVDAIWAAAMVNAGATILDHLPHGSFFHATGGCVEMSIKDRMRLIPFESAVGLTITLVTVLCYILF